MTRAQPAGHDVCSEAVRSVIRRGFHGRTPPATQQPELMAQFVRLVEEAGELDAARRRLRDRYTIGAELADVLIVASNLAWAAGMDPSALSVARFDPLRELWPLVADLARALRKYDHDPRPVEEALLALAAYCWADAGKPAMGIDLEDTIIEKLIADEMRGPLHGAAPSRAPWHAMAAEPAMAQEEI